MTDASAPATHHAALSTASEFPDSALLLRFFLEHAPAAIALFDREMNYLHVSRRWLAEYGLTGQEIIGRCHYDVFPELPDHWIAVHRRCLAGGDEESGEEEFCRLNGDSVWLRWTALPWRDGAGMVGGIIITTEHELRRSEQFREMILNSLPAHVAVIDGKGAIVAVNQSWRRFAADNGAPECGALLPGSNYLAACRNAVTLDSDLAREALAGLDAVLSGERPSFTLEYPCHSPDRKRWFLMNVVRPSDLSAGAIISHVDISERMQAEERLRENEERYRLLAETMMRAEAELRQSTAALRDSEQRIQQALRVSRSFTFEWHPDTDQVLRSASCAAILRLSQDEACNDTGERYFQRVHPEDRTRFVRILHELTPEADTYTTEYRVRDAGGTLVMLEETGRASFDESGRLHRLHGVTTDVTARKLAEAALRDSEKLYRAIGESIDYGVWVCLPDGRNIYASDSFLHLVGLTQEQCSDFGWETVLHPDDAAATLTAWQECVGSGGVWDVEHRYRGVDGHWHPVLARGVPVRNDAGAVIYWAGINLDISRMKRAEAQLQQAHDELEERVRERTRQRDASVEDLQSEMIERRRTLEELRERDHLLVHQSRLAAMGEMIGNIAHQWRQPLNILGLVVQDLSLAGEAGNLTPELLQVRVEKAMQVINHMSRTIDDFRNFFRPDKEKSSFRVSRIIESTLSLMEGSNQRHQIRFQVDTGPDPVVTGYPNEFAQVVLNIFANARDALAASAPPPAAGRRHASGGRRPDGGAHQGQCRRSSRGDQG